jgi:hypothetical protein
MTQRLQGEDLVALQVEVAIQAAVASSSTRATKMQKVLGSRETVGWSSFSLIRDI